MKFLPLVVALAATTGCQTIAFTHGRSSSRNGRVVSQWHGSILYSLVELSKPVNTKSACVGDWDQVITYDSFATSLLSNPYIHPFWNPEKIDIVCAESDIFYRQPKHLTNPE